MSILIKGMEMPESGDSYLLQITADGSIYDAFGRQSDFVARYVPPHVEHHDSNGCWNCEHYAVPVAWCAIDEGIYCATSCRDWKKKTPEALAKYLSKGDKA